MTDEDRDELRYHLQELPADLGLIRGDLEDALKERDPRTARSGWTGAWALLEHDLEVHLPRALELLGAKLPSAEPPQGHRSGDAANLATMAREARRLVEAAREALPQNGTESAVAIDRLTRVARLVQAAFALTAEVIEAREAKERRFEELRPTRTPDGRPCTVTGEERHELEYRLEELVIGLDGARIELETVEARGARGEPPIPLALGWEGAWSHLEDNLELHLPRALALLGAALPPAEPRPDPRATDPANYMAMAREARLLVEQARAALPHVDSESGVAIDKLTQAARQIQAAFALTAEVMAASAAMKSSAPRNTDDE